MLASIGMLPISVLLAGVIIHAASVAVFFAISAATKSSPGPGRRGGPSRLQLMTIADIVSNIDRGLAELEEEIAQLTTAKGALLNGKSPAVAPPRRRKSSTGSGRRSSTAATRAAEVVPAGKLLAVLGDSDGMRTRELAQATNGDPTQLLALLKEQEDAGQVRRSGTRAATRWHVVTDEDRAAARAAELRVASKRGRARKH